MFRFPSPSTLVAWSVVISLQTVGALDARAADTGGVEARIARVVEGLRPRVRFVGRPEPLMTLSDRMAHYHVPGVSVAVVDDYRIAWSRGFGVREQETVCMRAQRARGLSTPAATSSSYVSALSQAPAGTRACMCA